MLLLVPFILCARIASAVFTIKATLLTDPTHSFAQAVLQTAQDDIANSSPPLSPDFNFQILPHSSSCDEDVNSLQSLAMLAQNYYQD
ncbi:unnamed protein product, partial [Nippostrongylus brasiliensis]|uniref:Secreted protein n=2 Tax=Nippostrongylus brasiliensis TaxID=27835 RepID=A0A0N4XGQ9_NIPBR